jgi:outer membrane protein insertion porin family
VGGFWHYHKELLDVQKYFPIYKEVALVLKARWGFISPTVTSELVPFSEEFQVGGTNGDAIVRGYDEGTAGVRIESGSRDPIYVASDRPDDFSRYSVRATPTISYNRARSMSVYNMELQFPIAPPQIFGLLFFDAGRGFASTRGWKLAGDLWRSAGLGARMVVPGIGTIGFDFGYGFDDEVVGGWRPHFQIGRGF